MMVAQSGVDHSHSGNCHHYLSIKNKQTAVSMCTTFSYKNNIYLGEFVASIHVVSVLASFRDLGKTHRRNTSANMLMLSRRLATVSFGLGNSFQEARTPQTKQQNRKHVISSAYNTAHVLFTHVIIEQHAC